MEDILANLSWNVDSEPQHIPYNYDPRIADALLTRLDPLGYYRQLKILSGNSFLATVQSSRQHRQALVAAADLRATYKAADMARFPKVTSEPYVMQVVGDPHLPVVMDTGASISVTPNTSDFVGPI
jgi:hypothetical protein